MDFLNKFLYKNDHKFTEFYASQEFSRKICEWNIYYIKTVEVGLISEFLNKNRILAGGAVSNILSYEEGDREDSDYDIFFVKKNPCKFLEKIRNNYDYYETFNSISINYKKIKIQFIKRLYENENRVVGGFDLDPCRFFMNHKGEIYGTANAIKSLENRRMYINPCCQSRNFYSRIYKYCKEKGYKDIHIHTSINKLLFKGDNDYCNYYTSSDIRKDEMVIVNLLFSGNYDK